MKWTGSDRKWISTTTRKKKCISVVCTFSAFSWLQIQRAIFAFNWIFPALSSTTVCNKVNGKKSSRIDCRTNEKYANFLPRIAHENVCQRIYFCSSSVCFLFVARSLANVLAAAHAVKWNLISTNCAVMPCLIEITALLCTFALFVYFFMHQFRYLNNCIRKSWKFFACCHTTTTNSSSSSKTKIIHRWNFANFSLLLIKTFVHINQNSKLNHKRNSLWRKGGRFHSQILLQSWCLLCYFHFNNGSFNANKILFVTALLRLSAWAWAQASGCCVANEF